MEERGKVNQGRGREDGGKEEKGGHESRVKDAIIGREGRTDEERGDGRTGDDVKGRRGGKRIGERRGEEMRI